MATEEKGYLRSGMLTTNSSQRQGLAMQKEQIFNGEIVIGDIIGQFEIEAVRKTGGEMS